MPTSKRKTNRKRCIQLKIIDKQSNAQLGFNKKLVRTPRQYSYQLKIRSILYINYN